MVSHFNEVIEQESIAVHYGVCHDTIHHSRAEIVHGVVGNFRFQMADGIERKVISQ